MAKEITSLSDVSEGIRLIICDLWGVLHDGVEVYPAALSAIQQQKDQDVLVALLSNSPRPVEAVAAKMSAMGLGPNAYDFMVTSGELAAQAVRNYQAPFLIGLEEDREVLVQYVNQWAQKISDADVIFAMGMLRGQPLEAHLSLLSVAAGLKIPMICANADKWVHIGDTLLPCAGLLAEAYEELGGVVTWFGKPHPVVYQAVQKHLDEAINPENILVIGDNIETDIKGGAALGYRTLLVSEGVHRDDLKTGHDIKSLSDYLKSDRPDYHIKYLM